MKKTHIKHFYFLFFLMFTVRMLNAQQSETYSILITGNTSECKQKDTIIFKQWQNAISQYDSNAYLMLGNIYNLKNDFTKKLLSNNKYPLLLAPGEKEWANGSFSGKEKIKEIENIITEKYGGISFMPDAACPGPVEIVLNDYLVVILIDTYWWVHKYDRRFNKCGIETTADIIIQIEDAVRRHYSTKHIIIAGHNSIKSYGNSGGYFSLKQSVFQAPYTFFRKFPGSRKDNQHPDFKEFRDAMLSVLEKYPNIIYVSAGDANLQYFTSNKTHYIISGSMGKTSYVNSKLPKFSSSENGFATLNFSSDGTCELVFIGNNGVLFQKNIYHRNFQTKINQLEIIDNFPDSITCNASHQYNISKFGQFWLGQNYRTVWETSVKVPVFNIATKNGGLHIVKRGGGMQTLSLRLEDKNGKQYVLRSLEKNVEGAFSDDLKNTLAIDAVQDQISAANPYASLVVAKLAEYAGVYHTNPEIVYVPDDFRLGIYRQDVANQLFMFEERPDDNRNDIASFGRSENIVSTSKMLNNIFNDEDYFVDSEAYIRARLFDILINDWDRHEDQWRWASFEKDGNIVYKPIPRDRDQAFFVNEGVLPWLAARKWILPKIQGFDENTENVSGLAYNARYLDRNLLNSSSWKDWQMQIDSLRILLTPQKIEDAVLSFPIEIQPLCANQTAKILKIRLDNLQLMARKLYLFLATDVDITGTNRKDLFEITVINDTTVKITGFHIKDNKKKGKEIFNRVFYSSETKNIRVYGLDSQDKFIITGNSKNKIDITIIGGKGKDEVICKTNKKPNFIKIYDKKSTNISPVIKRNLNYSYDKNELEYDREAFQYNVVYPALATNYNQDDGIFLGGGVLFSKYSRYHLQSYKILANYAFLTDAYGFSFSGKNIYPLKHLEWNFEIDIKSPNYVNNFFGMGNETQWLVDKSEKEFYWLRMKENSVKTNFTKILDKNEIHKVSLGVFYKNTDVNLIAERFVSDFSQNGLEASDFQSNYYAGVSLFYQMSTMPKDEIKIENQFAGSKTFPTRGMLFDAEIEYFKGLANHSSDFVKISGEWSSYLSFSRRPRVVYAIKFGGEKLFGDYVFTEAAKLGQKENLRGYRQTRFYGDASLYLNTEMRVRLKQFQSYIVNGTAGLLFFNDVGRVWFDSENSSRWHDGYGIGFWISPFDMAVINFSYAQSREDNLINLSLNYQF